jgi:hypothetical protein
MSVKTLKESNITSKSGISENRHNWVRPSDWTPMPTIGENENKIAALFAVMPSNYSDVGSQFAAFSCNVSSGSYYVDWGDGTNNTYSTGVKAEHTYEPANIPSAVTTRGYKTALITVTPVTSGATFISFSILAHTNQSSISPRAFIDIIANTTYSGASISVGGTQATTRLLERALFNSNFRITSGAFSSCNSLQVLPSQLVFATLTGGYGYQTFADCFELEYIPSLVNFNLTAATPSLTLTNLFSNCYKLKEIPYFVIPDNVAPISTFSNCYSITTLPALNFKITGAATSTFQNCYNLKDTGKATFDFTNCTSVSAMFQSCYVLEKSPSLASITAACTSMASTWIDCRKLIEIPPLGNTSGVTTFQTTFSGCITLSTVNNTNINISAATTLTGMFSGCANLVDVYYPFTGTFKTTGLAAGCFNQIFGISQGSINRIVISQSFPPASSGATTSPAFPGYCRLTELDWPGIGLTFSIANNNLSAVQLNSIYSSLASGVTGKTITVTGNWGTASDNPSIATAKGWIVTG